MDNCRIKVVEILEQVFQNNAYSNIALSKELNNSNLNEKDKALVTEIVYGTIKYKYTLDKILNLYIRGSLDKLDSVILNILRMSIYQVKYLDKIPQFAAVNEAVNMAKSFKNVGASKFVNGVLRSYLRDPKENNRNSDSIEKLCYSYSFDKWMVKLFISQYGQDTAIKILKGSNEIPNVTTRVNNIKVSYEDAWEKLHEHGYNIEEGRICPEAINIIKGEGIGKNPLFYEGLISVQDESAMLVAASMDIKPNLEVLDLCSAPGGKTCHIGELMDNTGVVRAYDIKENKLSLIKANVERLGLKNIICDIMDGSKFSDNLVNSADRVLIDVPCSGLGIIRKKPEIKWTKNINQLKAIVSIQKNILINASRYVKKDGILLYSTCTLNKMENEENIKWFIKNNKNYSIEPLFYGNLDNIEYSDEGLVTVLPNKYMDGFFIAKLRKVR